MVTQGAPPLLEAPIVRITDPQAPLEGVRGALVIYEPDFTNVAASQVLRAGAAAVILRANDVVLQHWNDLRRAPAEPRTGRGRRAAPAPPRRAAC